jgi:DNA-binding response OmpR family regulator/two-component sensor histidine kinase
VKERTATIDSLLKQKEKLFSNVSHEFRTPLTLILTSIERLIPRPALKSINLELSMIQRSGQRLLIMVDQLLAFSRVENLPSKQIERVSLQQTISLMVASFESLMKSKHICLSVNDYKDVTLSMIPDSLNKILINILSNAFKYTAVQGQISLNVTTMAQTVEIAITDNGIGISEKDIEVVFVFERFSRVDTCQEGFTPGTGIGLALVKELVEANNGDISLSSKLNEGSTFTIVLPVSLGSQQEKWVASSTIADSIDQQLTLAISQITVNPDNIESDETTEVNVDNEQKSILIIDDNVDMRILLKAHFEQDYGCLIAENGQSGLNIAKAQLPDLIISDIMMPVMDGYQLAQQLKSDEMTCHIPIIMLTAKGCLESRLKGLELLIDDYIAKPFNLKELSLRVHNTLSIRDIVRKQSRHEVETAQTLQSDEKNSLNDIEQQFLDKLTLLLEQHHANPELDSQLLSELMHLSPNNYNANSKPASILPFLSSSEASA